MTVDDVIAHVQTIDLDGVAALIITFHDAGDFYEDANRIKKELNMRGYDPLLLCTIKDYPIEFETLSEEEMRIRGWVRASKTSVHEDLSTERGNLGV